MEAGMTATPDIRTETDALSAMLADPEIREALAVIVANAPALAAIASVSVAFIERGPEIADNINDAVLELREQAGGAEGIGKALPLVSALGERTDSITGLLDSPVLQPEVVEVVGRVGAAAKTADEATRGSSQTVGGIFSILGKLKDPNTQHALAFLFAFAEAFGANQAASSK